MRVLKRSPERLLRGPFIGTIMFVFKSLSYKHIIIRI